MYSIDLSPHNFETIWLQLLLEYTDIRYSDILRVLILWVPEQHNWRTDGLQMNCVGESSLMLTYQAPNWNTIDSLWWNTLTSGTVTFLHVLILWCQSWRTGDGWSPTELCGGEQSHAYIIKHPIETQLTSCDGNTLTSGTVTLLRVLILWVPEQHNWRRMVSKWIVWGEQSHAYIIKHPIETQLAPCDGIHWHQVQWHYYVYWFCECQSSTTGGRMVSKWIVWGRPVSCLHNQAPNLNTIDSLWWNTLTSGTVTFLHVLILWVPELENWGTDGLQLNCVVESSLMLT